MVPRSYVFVLLSVMFPILDAHGDFHPGSETGGLNALMRELEGGGHARNFIQRWFMKGTPDIQLGAAKGPITTDSNGVKEQTFISPPMTLLNGEITNKWLPIDWPEGHIMLKSFTADVLHAGADGQVPPVTPCCGGPYEAPRATSFLHHWTVNKWQLPGNMLKRIVKAGGLEWVMNLQHQGLTEVLAGAGLNSGANGPCWDSDLHLFFGIGNDVRGSPQKHVNGGPKEAYEFPEPYGVEFDHEEMRKIGQFMVLNTHVIDLRNVTNVRACTECECSYLNASAPDHRTTGGLSCCHSTHFDGGRCPLLPGAAASNQTYYIRYTIRWRDFDASTSKPLEVITLDATDNNTKWGDFANVPGGYQEKHDALRKDPLSLATINDARSGEFDGYRACHIEFYVPSCEEDDSCVLRITNSWKFPYPIDIVFVRHHFHAGGINMTTRSNQGPVCTGTGTYSDEGFLVDISTCTFGSSSDLSAPVRVDRGDQLSVETLYNQDKLPHFGVMAMSFLYAHVPKDQKQKASVLV